MGGGGGARREEGQQSHTRNRVTTEENKLKMNENKDFLNVYRAEDNDRNVKIFIYRRPTLYPLEIAVDFFKSP
jgi:hypothetical protein